ncbi:MAG: DUF1016 N-terminal domain-containing protein [Thiobacillus sp.]
MTGCNTPAPATPPTALLSDIQVLIDAVRKRAATAISHELTQPFWRIGQRIHTQVPSGWCAEYGEEALPELAAQLVRDYGCRFMEKNLHQTVQSATSFPEERIVVSLSRQLSQSHFVSLLPLKDPLQREHYAQMKPFCLQICVPSTLGATDKFRAFKAYAGSVQ